MRVGNEKRRETGCGGGKANANTSAYSLVEMIVVIAVIGIISSIAISAIVGVQDGTRRGVAQARVDRLNGGVSKYNQVRWEFDVSADNSSGDDELLVLRSLQWRDPVRPAHGAPFVQPDWNPSVSSDASTWRISWNGRAFHIIDPDTAGTGLLIRFDGNDQAQDVDFGSSFQPLAPSN